jgi:hypothetical protein
MTRRLHWVPIAALVVLAARALAYALAPHATVVGNELEQQAGGPGLVVTAVAVLTGAAVVASAVLWVAALAVRERHLLSGGAGEAPPLRPVRVLGTALGLFAVTSLAFASLESYLHWRAGLGFHGLHCLIGPVHRDALPILGALSLLAAAAEAAARHLLRWMRRTLQALRARPSVRPRPPALRLPPRADAPLRPALPGLDLARGPPAALPA